MSNTKNPDDVVSSLAESGDRVTCRLLDDETVLIEGSSSALASLGELLSTQASFEKDCGFHLGPSGPGSAVFSGESTHGIYIHRLPCDQENSGAIYHKVPKL